MYINDLLSWWNVSIINNKFKRIDSKLIKAYCVSSRLRLRQPKATLILLLLSQINKLARNFCIIDLSITEDSKRALHSSPYLKVDVTYVSTFTMYNRAIITILIICYISYEFCSPTSHFRQSYIKLNKIRVMEICIYISWGKSAIHTTF